MTRAVDFFSNARFTWLLVVVIAAVGIMVSDTSGAVLRSAVASPVITLFTYPFVHSGPVHLVANIIALLLGGTWCERRLGAAMMLLVFAIGCLSGGIIFLAVTFAVPAAGWLEGASAGIIALVVCAAGTGNRVWHIATLTMTGRSFNLFILVIVAVGIVGPNPGGAAAHIGGWLAGYFISLILTRRHSVRASIDRRGAIERVKLSGYASLSAEQRAKLFNNRDK